MSRIDVVLCANSAGCVDDDVENLRYTLRRECAALKVCAIVNSAHVLWPALDWISELFSSLVVVLEVVHFGIEVILQHCPMMVLSVCA